MGQGERHNYEYNIDIEGTSAPARIVRMVGKNKTVLEIGAGPGSTTKHLVETGQCTVTALEIDDDAISKLSQYANKIYPVDLNDATWPELLASDGLFNVVVAGDVLEHLYEPWDTLKLMKELLTDDGYIVVSLPHVSHSSVVACLMDEDFHYQDVGLLDRTHIRFFGIKNIQNLFEDAGMKIVHAEFVVRAPEHTEFSKCWAKTPQELRDALANNPFGLVYQVIVKAVPVTSEGVAISLMDLAVKPQSPSIIESIKAFLRLHLSKGAYSKLSLLNDLRRKYFLKK